jgi:hypothetical protein
MRGRVIAVLVLFLSLSLSPAAESQCNWTPRYSGQFRTTAFDVSLDNEYLWLATGYGVQLLRRNGTEVTALDAIALPGATRIVRANGSGYAYAGSGSRLYVLRRNGTQIETVRFVDTAGTIQDLQIHQGADLFVATAKGAAHYSLVPADSPMKSNAIFATSSQNVSKIAINGNTLYTADGDASVEIFNIQIPSLAQKTDQLTSVLAATAVFATSDNFVYVSDRFGQNTDVFSGTTRLARMPIGATSFAPSATRVHFVAGPDRTVRAVDFNDLTRTTELFESLLPSTDGTENTIHAMVRSGDTVFVAAGDIGLVTFDATPLAKPAPLAGYVTGATTSSLVVADTAWLSNAAGTIAEYKINPQGVSLAQQRSWTTGANALVHDYDDAKLLASSGDTATVWSLTPATPAVSLTVTFPAAIAKAVLHGNSIVAMLADGTIHKASGTTPQAVNVPAMASLARYGSSIGLMQLLDDGRTVIHHYANGDFGTAARTYTLNGSAIGNLALDHTRAALFLFNGVNIVDLASGTATPIAGSNGVYPIQLAFAGDDLLVLADKTLYVYDDGRTLARAQPLTANAIGMGTAAPYAVIASSEGLIASLYLRDVPAATLTTSSSFYTKLLADGDRLHLLSRDGIDIYSTATSTAPHFFTSIRAANIVDVATTAGRVYTLSGGSTVTAYSHAGAILGQVTINEGIDTQPLSIAAAGNAVWVSISKGCLSGQCERKTLVLDPQTLLTTDTMTGQAVDVAASGTRAYVLTDTPDQIRIVNITDPLHPSPLVSSDAPVNARSLAHGAGNVYVLADKVYAFNNTTLSATGTFLSAVTPTNAHQIRIAGTCALVAGRSANPELYTVPAFSAAGNAIELPSNARGMIATPSRVLVLTEHSIEVWSTDGDAGGKRRGVR